MVSWIIFIFKLDVHGSSSFHPYHRSLWPTILASETEFEPILRRRLNLFGLDCDDSLRHLMFRNDRELYFFNHMLQQLYQLHDILQKIPQEDEKIFVS